jgi:hypothetical protein
LDAYIVAACIEDPKVPLFQSLDKAHKMTGEAISRSDMLRVVKQRCKRGGTGGIVLQSHVSRHGHYGVSQ